MNKTTKTSNQGYFGQQLFRNCIQYDGAVQTLYLNISQFLLLKVVRVYNRLLHNPDAGHLNVGLL